MSHEHKDFSRIAKAFRVRKGELFRLKDVNPSDTLDFTSEDRPEAVRMLQHGTERLCELQERLYAEGQRSLLIIFQAMDAAGKDGAIKHVMSGVNPQGCQVHSFKAPSAEELGHDFFWRCGSRLPSRGHIGIFNRSYYEETLVVRVHPEILGKQRIPDELITKRIWDERFDSIRNFEEHLTRNGTRVLKFFLHVSRTEQERRFRARLETPLKNWKFSPSDLQEREFWDKYQRAYQEMIRLTSTADAPWYVVPADHKWFTRLVVSAAIVHAMSTMDIKDPVISADMQKAIAAAKRRLRIE